MEMATETERTHSSAVPLKMGQKDRNYEYAIAAQFNTNQAQFISTILGLKRRHERGLQYLAQPSVLYHISEGDRARNVKLAGQFIKNRAQFGDTVSGRKCEIRIG